MSRNKALIIGFAFALVSGVVIAGGGCLAGHYQYFDAAGQQVGAASVGCQNNWSWGISTDDAVFVASCGEES